MPTYRPRNYEKSKRSQFEQYLAKGLSPAQANRLVKELSAVDPGKRKGLRPQIANRYARLFFEQRRRTQREFPSRRGGRILGSMATPSNFTSPAIFNHRYLVDFKFTATNPATGQQQTYFNTIGLRTLSFEGKRIQTYGQLERMIKQRIAGLEDRSEQYFPTGFIEPDLGSINVTGFFRTTNV